MRYGSGQPRSMLERNEIRRERRQLLGDFEESKTTAVLPPVVDHLVLRVTAISEASGGGTAYTFLRPPRLSPSARLLTSPLLLPTPPPGSVLFVVPTGTRQGYHTQREHRSTIYVVVVEYQSMAGARLLLTPSPTSLASPLLFPLSSHFPSTR